MNPKTFEKYDIFYDIYNINNISIEALQKISDNFYRKIYDLYSNFNSAGDYLIKFTDYMNTKMHFNNLKLQLLQSLDKLFTNFTKKEKKYLFPLQVLEH